MTAKKPALLWLKKAVLKLLSWPRLQRVWRDGLGPSNIVFLLAAFIGVIAGLLAVFLKNGIGWLRHLPPSLGSSLVYWRFSSKTASAGSDNCLGLPMVIKVGKFGLSCPPSDWYSPMFWCGKCSPIGILVQAFQRPFMPSRA